MIYMDNNSTTRIDPRVLNAMMPYLTDEYANASSTHAFGSKISNNIKSAREQIAELVNCSPSEIILTSGATESINLGIKGIMDSYRKKGNHIVTISTEHYAVLDTCKYLESIGYEITYLPVEYDGMLDLELLSEVIRENTILVCAMLTNNETGVIHPIHQIAEIAHKKNALFMTDATQAIGKLKIDVKESGIDLMAFSGHKFYAPKGTGGLYINEQARLKILPLLHGGGHEKGLRSGTLNVPNIIGIGKAAEIALNDIDNDKEYVGGLRDHLEKELLSITDTIINGNIKNRIYNTCNICFKRIDADAVISGLKNIAVSNGSACTSNLIEPSHVLKAMGLTDDDAFSSIRFSLGRFNTLDEVKVVIEEMKSITHKLRAIV